MEEEGEEEENEKERGEEEREEEEEKGEEKETEPERRGKSERGRKRQKGRVSGAAFPLPFLRSLARALRSLGLQLSPGDAGNWVGLYGATPPPPPPAPPLGGRGFPPSAARAPPASSRSPPRSSRRRVGRSRQCPEPPARVPPRAPRPQPPAGAPEGRPSPPPPERGGPARFRPRSCAPGPGRPARGAPAWARGACPGSACSSCWSTPAPPSTAEPCKVRKEGAGLRGPRAGARFPEGRAGAGKRAAVRTRSVHPPPPQGGPDLWALRPRRKARRARGGTSE